MTTAIEYALLAGASYISTRPDINKFPIPNGWNQISYSPPAPSGFEAATFTNGSEIVISFAGTKDIYDIGDNAANADLIAGLGSAQFA